MSYKLEVFLFSSECLFCKTCFICMYQFWFHFLLSCMASCKLIMFFSLLERTCCSGPCCRLNVKMWTTVWFNWKDDRKFFSGKPNNISSYRVQRNFYRYLIYRWHSSVTGSEKYNSWIFLIFFSVIVIKSTSTSFRV